MIRNTIKEESIVKKLLKILKITGILILSAIFLLLLGIKVYSLILEESEIIELNNEIRENLEGNFILLSDGYTNYELIGPENGQTVVLIHGFFIPSSVWDLNIDNVADSGFRVLRYDTFGRGYSDRPDVEYDTELYTRQLYDLIDKLNLNAPIDLIGSSHGGMIIMAFTEKYPELVRRLVLVNPAGFTFTEAQLQFGKIVNTFTSAIGIQKIIMNEKTLRDIFKNISEEPNESSSTIYNNFDKILEQLKYKGLRNAVYSAVRNLESNAKEVYEDVANTNKDIMLIWGEQDKGIPLSTAYEIIDTIPDIKYRFLKDDGHTPHVTNPEVFNNIVIDFLSK